MLYVLVSGYPNAAHALREKIFHASKQDFRFNLMCGMIYGKPDAVPLLENGNSVIMFLSRMQNVLEKYAPCEETLCESRIFACKMNTASWILDIYDVLCSGKFVSFPEKTFGPPDRRISGICADTVSLLKKNMYHSYSRETLKILLRHVHSMMTTAPGGLFGIPGGMVPATGGTNFTECEITELERILVEIIKRDSDFRYWKNYHSLFQTIAG